MHRPRNGLRVGLGLPEPSLWGEEAARPGTMALFPAFAGVAEAPDGGRKGEPPGGMKKALGGLGGESLGLALGACQGLFIRLYPRVLRGAAGPSGRPASRRASGPELWSPEAGRGGRGRGPGASVQSFPRHGGAFTGGTPDASAGCPSLQLAFFPVLLISESLTGCLLSEPELEN